MSGPLPEKEMRRAILGLAGAMTAADDQAHAMTDAELGELLLTGRWTTIEIHEAYRDVGYLDQTAPSVSRGGSGVSAVSALTHDLYGSGA